MKRIFFLFLPVAIAAFTACSISEKGDIGSDTSGQGGSLARFTVKGDYLYTVDVSTLHTFSLANKEKPEKKDDDYLNFYTETIFPYGDHLLLGTDNGMYVYNLTNPANPAFSSFFNHITSCDPVVAENGYAYLTLNSSNQRCFRGLNLLQIVDIHNLENPMYKSGFDLSSPLGLDIHNDTLYVCDKGLKILDVSNKLTPQLIYYFDDIQAADVIYNKGLLIVTGNQGVVQYRVSGNTIEKISTLPTTP